MQVQTYLCKGYAYPWKKMQAGISQVTQAK